MAKLPKIPEDKNGERRSPTPQKTEDKEVLENYLTDIKNTIKKDFMKTHEYPRLTVREKSREMWLETQIEDVYRNVIITGVGECGKTYLITGLVDYLRSGYGSRFRVIYGQDYINNKIITWKGKDKKGIDKTKRGKIHPVVLRIGGATDAKYIALWDISGEDYVQAGEGEEDLSQLVERKPTQFFKDNLEIADGIISVTDLIGKIQKESNQKKSIVKTAELGKKSANEFNEKCECGNEMILSPDSDYSKYKCTNCDKEKIAYEVMKLYKQEKNPVFCTKHNKQLVLDEDTHSFRCEENNCTFSKPAKLDWTKFTTDRVGAQAAYVQRLMEDENMMSKKWLSAISKTDMFHGLEENITKELYSDYFDFMALVTGEDNPVHYISVEFEKIDPKTRTYGLQNVVNFFENELFN